MNDKVYLVVRCTSSGRWPEGVADTKELAEQYAKALDDTHLYYEYRVEEVDWIDDELLAQTIPEAPSEDEYQQEKEAMEADYVWKELGSN